MNGLELSEKYFETYGRPAFYARHQDIFGYLCFALCGPGSECFGVDDELSRAHDFEPGFCVFYPEDKLSSREVFKLERTYAGLPQEFDGFQRKNNNYFGEYKRRGVIGINEYFSKTGNDISIRLFS